MLSLLAAASPSTGAIVGVQPLWTNRYDGAGYYDYAFAVTTDCGGNAFACGASYHGALFSDYLTIAYSGAGVPLWTNRYNGPADQEDRATAMAADQDGNIFVTGYSEGYGSSTDYATVAYSNMGTPLWTNRYNGPGNAGDAATAVAVDGAGNVFVTGSSFGDGTLADFLTIAYSGTGLPLWTNRFNGPKNNHDMASALAVDHRGNVFVTGYAFEDFDINADYVTIAYSGLGVPLWTNIFDGPGHGNDVAVALALDSSGNVLVTGESTGSVGHFEYATIAYSSTGVPLWTNRYGRLGNGDHSARALAVDKSGNVFVTGSSGGSGGGYDYLTLAYSAAGVPLWTNHFNGPANGSDTPYAVAVDGRGNVFVTGESFRGTFPDCATVAYSGAGVPLWTNCHNGSADTWDGAFAVAVDDDGDVFVAGYSHASGSAAPDFLTIKCAAMPPAPILSTSPRLPGGAFLFGFTNLGGYSFTAFAATNVALPPNHWDALGPVPEITAGQYRFTDVTAGHSAPRFYQVRSP